ncbi:MAG: glycosyltransferase family A protein [Syntrophobacteraceae bacterium]
MIVVDYSSSDNLCQVCAAREVKVIRFPKSSGPAAARNRGAAEARGDILLFVDSDVVIRRDSVARVVDSFVLNPDIAAVFGSYDDDPAEKDFFSQYKNLVHLRQRLTVTLSNEDIYYTNRIGYMYYPLTPPESTPLQLVNTGAYSTKLYPVALPNFTKSAKEPKLIYCRR